MSECTMARGGAASVSTNVCLERLAQAGDSSGKESSGEQSRMANTNRVSEPFAVASTLAESP